MHLYLLVFGIIVGLGVAVGYPQQIATVRPHVIAVMSGKGGAGKSLVTGLLASTLYLYQ